MGNDATNTVRVSANTYGQASRRFRLLDGACGTRDPRNGWVWATAACLEVSSPPANGGHGSSYKLALGRPDFLQAVTSRIGAARIDHCAEAVAEAPPHGVIGRGAAPICLPPALAGQTQRLNVYQNQTLTASAFAKESREVSLAASLIALLRAQFAHQFQGIRLNGKNVAGRS
jgi:hypothetical protein